MTNLEKLIADTSDHLASAGKVMELLVGALWRIVDNVPLDLKDAQLGAFEALQQAEKIAGGDDN